jgi:2-haloacid dehalogenase
MAIQGLLFDVFGTLVDWRRSISRQARDILAPKGFSLPWDAFADAWRAEYQPALEEIRSGREPFHLLDEIHRMNLEKVLKDIGIGGLDKRTLNQISMAWHRLDAWPDVHEGLTRLGSRFRIAPAPTATLRWSSISPGTITGPGTRSWEPRWRATISPSLPCI